MVIVTNCGDKPHPERQDADVTSADYRTTTIIPSRGQVYRVNAEVIKILQVRHPLSIGIARSSVIGCCLQRPPLGNLFAFTENGGSFRESSHVTFQVPDKPISVQLIGVNGAHRPCLCRCCIVS